MKVLVFNAEWKPKKEYLLSEDDTVKFGLSHIGVVRIKK